MAIEAADFRNKISSKELHVTKPEWGTKRTCPKCGTRFYDLGKDNPAVCIDCATEWVPEAILKAKQSIIPIKVEPKVEEVKKPEAESEGKSDNGERPT